MKESIDCVCSVCGQEMRAEFDTFRSGSNEPFMRVMPCCQDEESDSRASYVEDDELPELQENILNLIESVQKFMEHDSKEQRQEIADYSQELRSRIKDLISEGIR